MYNKYIKRGIFFGSIFTIVTNICIILLLYKYSVDILNYLFFLVGPIFAIVSYFYFRSCKIKEFFISILSSIFVYLILEIIIVLSGIDYKIYLKICSVFSDEISNVDGLIIIFTHIYNLFWVLIGLLITFIYLCFRLLRHKNKL